MKQLRHYPFIDLGNGAFSCDARDAGMYGFIYAEDGLFGPCCVVVIPAYCVMSEPIDLFSLAMQEVNDQVHFMHIFLHEGAKATCIGNGMSYGTHQVIYECGVRSQLTHAVLCQAHGKRSYTFRMAQEAVVNTREVVVVGAYQQLCVDVLHEHKGQKSNADSFFLSIVGDNACIRNEHNVVVETGIKDIVSSLKSRALLTGNDACAYASPGLRIGHGAVRCAHGAAIGSLDDELIWVLLACGLSREQAENQLLQGLAQEALGLHIAQATIRDCLAAR